MAEGVPGAFAQDATLAQEDSTVAPYQPAYAARTCQNRRPYNEDAFCVHLNLLAEAGSSPLQAPLSEVPSPQPCTLMFAGVFDGHGGGAVSQFCSQQLPAIVRRNIHQVSLGGPVEGSCLGRLLQHSFEECDKAIPEAAAAEGGSTAVCCLVGPSRIWVASCGDSRAVVARKGGQAIALTDDHKPERPDEAARIRAAGGHVFWNGGHRVMGVLSMSRAMGDAYLKQFGVIPTPEMCELERSPDDQFLLLASDGLWGAIGNQEAVDVARACVERALARGADRTAALRVAAQVLVRAAIQNGSHDNITVVLLDLEHPQADSQAQPAHQPHAHHPDLHLQHPVLVPVQCEGTPMQGEPGPVMCMPAVGAPAQPQAEVRHLDSAASHAQVEQAQAQQRRPAFTKPTLQLQGLPEPQLEPAEAAALQQLRQYPAASADAPMGLCPVLTPQGALQGCGGLGRLLEGGGVGAADAGSPPPLVWNTAAGAVNGPSGAADAMGHQGQGSVGGHYVEMVRSPYTRCVSLPSGVGNGSPTSSAPPTQPQGQGQAAPAQLPQQHHHQAHQLSRLGPAGGSPGHSPSAAAPAPEAFQPNGAGAPAAASAELAHPWGAHVAAQALAGGLAGSPLPQPHQPQLQLFAEHRSPRKRYKELEPAAEGPSNSSGSGSGSGTGSGTESGSPAGGVDEQGDEVDDGLRAVLVPLYLGVEDLAEPCCSPAHAAFSPAGGTPGAAAGAAAGRGLGSPFGGLDPFPERLLVSVQPAGSPRRTA